MLQLSEAPRTMANTPLTPLSPVRPTAATITEMVRVPIPRPGLQCVVRISAIQLSLPRFRLEACLRDCRSIAVRTAWSVAYNAASGSLLPAAGFPLSSATVEGLLDPAHGAPAPKMLTQSRWAAMDRWQKRAKRQMDRPGRLNRAYTEPEGPPAKASSESAAQWPSHPTRSPPPVDTVELSSNGTSSDSTLSTFLDELGEHQCELTIGKIVLKSVNPLPSRPADMDEVAPPSTTVGAVPTQAAEGTSPGRLKNVPCPRLDQDTDDCDVRDSILSTGQGKRPGSDFDRVCCGRRCCGRSGYLRSATSLRRSFLLSLVLLPALSFRNKD
eukprot:s4847_g1.t1